MREQGYDKNSSGLRDLLQIDRGEIAAVVGAGGKTGTINRLAREFKYRGVICTTTTALLLPHHLPFRLELVNSAAEFRGAVLDYVGGINSQRFGAEPEMLVTGTGLLRSRPGAESRDKLKGLDPAWMAGIDEKISSQVMLVEADGAASHNIKFPAAHEPALPAQLDHLLVIQGAAAVGRELRSPHCFRSHLHEARSHAGLALYRELFAGECGYGPYLRGNYDSHLILSQLEGHRRAFFRKLCLEIEKHSRGSSYRSLLAFNNRTGSASLHYSSAEG